MARLNRFATRVATLLVMLQAAGCAEGYTQSSMVTMTSDFGPAINSLYSLFTWISLAVFVVVEVLLVYAIVRFRKQDGDTSIPKQVHGHTTGEILWTIAPALIVLAIAIPTIKTIFLLAKPPERADVVQVHVVGRQWWWRFEYPAIGVVTANELHLPVGKTAVFKIDSDDVIHSFWFPNAGGKRDAVPGHTNSMYFTPVQVGTFTGQCAEYCGTSHANMRMTLVVESEADFKAWVELQKAPAASVTDATVAAGKDAFVANCMACHRINAAPESGIVSFGQPNPDLTHVAGRQTFGSGLYAFNAANLHKWLKNPQAAKPGSLMKLPAELDDETVNNLVAFLQTLK
jgi:cytochrome c oxidase subunit 2